jgi:GcrA cell cycle regulator
MEWTDERIATLTRMWRDGFSASQVARELGGVTRSAVIGKIHRLGVAGRALPAIPRSSTGRPPNKVRVSSGGAVRVAASRPPRPVAPSLAPFEVSVTATVLTLSEHGCRWPIGDPTEADFGFCGRACPPRGSYCEGHGFMALRVRDPGMKPKHIDHIVRRFVEGSNWASREASEDATREASLAFAAC